MNLLNKIIAIGGVVCITCLIAVSQDNRTVSVTPVISASSLGQATNVFIGAGTGLTITSNTPGSVYTVALSGSIFSGGLFLASTMPAFTGDITTVAGAVATTLKSTGTAGTYRSTTFDAQGRETSGSNPTTFSGYAITDTSANLAAALTDETGTGPAVFADSPVFTTRITTPQIAWTTNVATQAPNFTLGAQQFQTNAAFTLLAPAGFNNNMFETIVYIITNSTAAAVLITAPANVHTEGTWYVTNVTTISFSHMGSFWTNAISYPLW